MQTSNEDGRASSCVSLAFLHLGISQTAIEAVQEKAPLHTIPFPLWLQVLELCAINHLEVYDWHGTLTEFIQQHQLGKFFTIIEITGEEEISKQKTHAVAIVDGASYNISDMNRPIFRVWKVHNGPQISAPEAAVTRLVTGLVTSLNPYST